MTEVTINDVIESDNMDKLEKIVAVSQIVRGKNLGYWEKRASW